MCIDAALFGSSEASIDIFYDNFRDFSEYQKYVLERNGATVERRLTTDRLLWKTGEIEIGPKYYAARRVDYKDCRVAFALTD